MSNYNTLQEAKESHLGNVIFIKSILDDILSHVDNYPKSTTRVNKKIEKFDLENINTAVSQLNLTNTGPKNGSIKLEDSFTKLRLSKKRKIIEINEEEEPPIKRTKFNPPNLWKPSGTRKRHLNEEDLYEFWNTAKCQKFEIENIVKPIESLHNVLMAKSILTQILDRINYNTEDLNHNNKIIQSCCLTPPKTPTKTPEKEIIVKERKSKLSASKEEPDPKRLKLVSKKPKAEKCQLRKELIVTLMKDSYTARWTCPTPNKPYRRVNIPNHCQEFHEVNAIFCRNRGFIKIVKLERIENPYLVAQFLLKKAKMEARSYAVAVRSFFHGTRKEYIDSICKYNLDWRFNGISRGHKFGKGVSFTPRASYAKHYSPFQDKIMFLCKVLVCYDCLGDYETVLPPSGFDTTTNRPRTVFVKYEDDDFFPQYLIHFDYDV